MLKIDQQPLWPSSILEQSQNLDPLADLKVLGFCSKSLLQLSGNWGTLASTPSVQNVACFGKICFPGGRRTLGTFPALSLTIFQLDLCDWWADMTPI